MKKQNLEFATPEFLKAKLQQLHEDMAEKSEAYCSLADQRYNQIMARFQREMQDNHNLAMQAQNAMLRIAEQCAKKPTGTAERAHWKMAETASAGKGKEPIEITSKTYDTAIKKLGTMLTRPLIDDLCDAIGMPVLATVRHTLTVKELGEIDEDWRVSYLSGIVDGQVKASKELYIWKGRHAYAPKIVFAMDGETPLHYDECGKVMSPAMVFKCPFLGTELHVTLDGGTVYAMRGELIKLEEGKAPVFVVKPSNEFASHLLLAVEWGGAHQKTRGRTAEEVAAWDTLTANYLEKVASKKGGEGYDYYILPVEQPNGVDLNRSTIEAGVAFSERIAQGESTYFQKLLLLDRLHKRDAQLQAKIQKTNDELSKLGCYCTEFATENRLDAFVHEPYLRQLNLRMDDRLYSRNTDLATLGDLLTRDDIWDEVDNYLSLARIQVNAWTAFAPLYAALQSVVASLHGWMEVYDEYVEIILPRQDTSDDAPIRQIFWFSEGQLNECLSFLKDYQDYEVEAREENRKQLEKMVGHEVQIDYGNFGDCDHSDRDINEDSTEE